MAKSNNSSKVTPIRRFTWLNIGTMLYGSILIYIIITVFMYLTARHITTYEVTAGSISGNYRYSALALKTEELQTAPYSGFVTYYARSGSRSGSGSVICSIDEYETKPTEVSNVQLTDEDYSSVKSTAKSFALNFTPSAFQGTYTLKADLDTYLVMAAATQDSSQISYLSNIVTSPTSGFVVYQTDGMETLTEADLGPDLFRKNNYSSTNLRKEGRVSFGDALYKLVQGEEWYLYFPISRELSASLADRTTMRFRFLKDDTTFSTNFSVLQKGEDYYGKLTLKNSLVRYVTDRFLDIELLLDSKLGLKVPTTSISEKTFIEIPTDYVITNEDDTSTVSLIRESFRSDGSSETQSITANVYSKTSTGYLVSPDLFEIGDYVDEQGSVHRHQITEDDFVKIQGVFNINKGYAVFREVTIIDENEEFCVVEPNNPYGLAAHDYIALDASTVTDDDIVY